MTSCNSHDRSKNIKNMKTKPTIFMVILMIVVTTILMTKPTTLLKTVIRIII